MTLLKTSRNCQLKLFIYIKAILCRPFKIRDSPLDLYLRKTAIRVIDLKSVVRMRPKHFSCKCTTKRNPIFVNWSCNARSGGEEHRQCFFVRAFPIISQLLRWRWRTLPIIYLPLMGSFILSRLYHISRKKRMFSFWNCFVTVFIFRVTS